MHGRDGRQLVSTKQAAYTCGWSAAHFRKWAERRGVRAKAYKATGTRGRPAALWDLADITDAMIAARLPTP